MALILGLFAAASALLWLSVYGYLGVLALVARRRPRARVVVNQWPDVALIIPVLNEARTIDAKLADLVRTDYPPDKLQVVVVDGGSVDGTPDRVRAAIADGARVTLWEVDASGVKARQVNYAIARLPQTFAVVTDADARLAPSCVRELIHGLIDDPQTAIMGASIHVATDLPEERLHWWGINTLWWLEGEALSAAIVSGVCYAARRSALGTASPTAQAEDAYLSLRAAAQGLRVRLSRTAWATEVRVPHNAHELLQFRRRRGLAYLEVLQRHPAASLSRGATMARWIRLFHFRVTPVLAIAIASLALVLLASPYWRWVLGIGATFFASATVVLRHASLAAAGGSSGSLALTTIRLVGLIWISLLTLGTRRMVPTHTVPRAHRLISVDTEVGS